MNFRRPVSNYSFLVTKTSVAQSAALTNTRVRDYLYQVTMVFRTPQSTRVTS